MKRSMYKTLQNKATVPSTSSTVPYLSPLSLNSSSILPPSASPPPPPFFFTPPAARSTKVWINIWKKINLGEYYKQKILQDPIRPPPSTPPIVNRPASEYLVVERDKLIQLLRPCTRCPSGQNSLSFRMEGFAFTCTGKCDKCGALFTWGNSKPLHTAQQSSRDKLPKINVDIVTGSILSSVGSAVSSGIHCLLNSFLKWNPI